MDTMFRAVTTSCPLATRTMRACAQGRSGDLARSVGSEKGFAPRGQQDVLEGCQAFSCKAIFKLLQFGQKSDMLMFVTIFNQTAPCQYYVYTNYKIHTAKCLHTRTHLARGSF